MTAFADRVLLRSLAVAVLLAVALTAFLTIGQRPFGYHDWPKPTVSEPVERPIRTAPASSAAGSTGRAPAKPPAGRSWSGN